MTEGLQGNCLIGTTSGVVPATSTFSEGAASSARHGLEKLTDHAPGPTLNATGHVVAFGLCTAMVRHLHAVLGRHHSQPISVSLSGKNIGSQLLAHLR
jgi:hypothetical protein